jgi:hypothetical protein
MRPKRTEFVGLEFLFWVVPVHFYHHHHVLVVVAFDVESELQNPPEAASEVLWLTLFNV